MPEIIVHHLNNSRSQRVLWLLEELELPYSLRRYERDAETLLAPAALREVHPLGKSPMIEDGQRVVAESGAIVEYLAVRHGNGRLLPEPGSDDYWRCRYFMHFARSAGVPVVCAYFHYPDRRIGIGKLFEVSADLDADMAAVRAYYRPFIGKHRGTLPPAPASEPEPR